MPTTYEIIAATATAEDATRFAEDVLAGLTATPKYVSSKYFYDEAGSRLFQDITNLAEYYPTDCEIEVLRTHQHAIGELVQGESFRLIELGVGDGRKTLPLLEEFVERGCDFDFVPVDICEQTVSELANDLHDAFGEKVLSVRGIVAEYFDALDALHKRDARRNLVLFFGSNIGNFDARQSRAFLRRLRETLQEGDYALIGFDLKKDISVLERAYNDSQGVTSEFNYNLLDRINRELGGKFDRHKFQHIGRFNVEMGRMESWLVSTANQFVWIEALQQEFYFQAWEGLHVENSYKYDPTDIAQLAADTGFDVKRNLFDSRRWFVNSIWQAD